MALAAMMLGLPMPDEGDAHAYLDIEAGSFDPDLLELREELRPPLSDRWTSWTEAASMIPTGHLAMVEVYGILIKPDNMPFLQCSDVRLTAIFETQFLLI